MLKRSVYMSALAVRQLRDDPSRAGRLAVRLAARAAPSLGRTQLAKPKPRDPQREAADLRELLATPPYPARPRATGDVRGVLMFVTNSLPVTNAGYTVRTHRIAVAQREALDWDTHVVTRLGHPLAQGVGDARARVDVDGVPYHRLLPWGPPSGPVGAVEKAADLAERLVRDVRPDVLHAVSDHRNAAVALELGKRHGLPITYEVRGFLEDSWLSRSPSHRPSDDFYRLTRELETRRMHEADAVVTLGEAMRAEIAGRGVDPAKITVVPNAVDTGFLEPLPDASDLRAGLGLPGGVPVIGLTSSFYGYEGIDTLIDAAALLRAGGDDVTLLLVGNGPERAALERRSAERGVRAVFTGRVPPSDVRRFHALLDVFAVPRRADRVCQLVTPLKPLEAMAGGIPVIASDVSALREIVEPGVTGTLTLPEDAEAWANSLGELIYSPELRMKLGRAAREWVRDERTWHAVTARYRAAHRP
ncbi:glycosyltransferase family 4 protein [Actinomadura oligospora]|uniref:glycosyltransferase family 4 protein n=1 Tax=Actinomadura oligospora TaxID=111804 RepID=UPI001FE04B9C|nr:glycosyltransferase family 4 protein [Actinomadura oligospora]